MTAARSLFAASFRQLVGARRTYLLAALALLPAFVMFVGSSRMTEARAFEFLHEGPFIVLLLAVVPIIALVLSAAALGEEKRQGTMSFIALRPLPRWVIIATKVTAAWAATFSLVGVGGAVTVAAYAVRTGDWEPLVPMLVMMAINSMTKTGLLPSSSYSSTTT